MKKKKNVMSKNSESRIYIGNFNSHKKNEDLM